MLGRLQGLVETPDGFQGRLVLAKEELPEFGASLPELKLNVWFESDERVRIKITDPQDSRWEIPEDILPLPGQAENEGCSAQWGPPQSV
jgi:alpha-glucosidase